jgi:hypothetical protein
MGKLVPGLVHHNGYILFMNQLFLCYRHGQSYQLQGLGALLTTHETAETKAEARIHGRIDQFVACGTPIFLTFISTSTKGSLVAVSDERSTLNQPRSFARSCVHRRCCRLIKWQRQPAGLIEYECACCLLARLLACLLACSGAGLGLDTLDTHVLGINWTGLGPTLPLSAFCFWGTGVRWILTIVLA